MMCMNTMVVGGDDVEKIQIVVFPLQFSLLLNWVIVGGDDVNYCGWGCRFVVIFDVFDVFFCWLWVLKIVLCILLILILLC